MLASRVLHTQATFQPEAGLIEVVTLRVSGLNGASGMKLNHQKPKCVVFLS